MTSLDDENIDTLIKLMNSQKESLTNEIAKMEQGREEHLKEKQNITAIERMLKVEEDRLEALKNGWFVSKREDKMKKIQEDIAKMVEDLGRSKMVVDKYLTSSTNAEKLKKDIDEIVQRIVELKKKENIPTPESPWRLIKDEDSVYDKQIEDFFQNLFYNLDIKHILSEWKEGKEQSAFLNIILIGVSGAGKSAFINTCATALRGTNDIIHRAVDQTPGSVSVTQRLNVSPLKDRNGKQLPIRLFDCRGMCQEIGNEEMRMIIKGHVKPQSKILKALEMTTNKESYRENPGLKDEIHCIVYVLKVDRPDIHGDEKSKALYDEIADVRKQFTPDNVPQCVLLTNIDKILPNDGFGKMFHYPCVKRHCRKAGDDLHIPMKNVFPVSNYHDEGSANAAKNAMALHILWKIVGLCINHIENHQDRGDVLDGFYD